MIPINDDASRKCRRQSESPVPGIRKARVSPPHRRAPQASSQIRVKLKLSRNWGRNLAGRPGWRCLIPPGWSSAPVGCTRSSTTAIASLPARAATGSALELQRAGLSRQFPGGSRGATDAPDGGDYPRGRGNGALQGWPAELPRPALRGWRGCGLLFAFLLCDSIARAFGRWKGLSGTQLCVSRHDA